MSLISGFSKLTRQQKIKELNRSLMDSFDFAPAFLDSFQLTNAEEQHKIESFSENVLSNFHLPFSVAPNFLVNGKSYFVPMVTEESSTVAAAAKAASFWYGHGGFHTQIEGREKSGNVHFEWVGADKELLSFWQEYKEQIVRVAEELSLGMKKRGGGINSIELQKDENFAQTYKIHCRFDTVDAMGANFINTVLEGIASYFKSLAQDKTEIIMSILSNQANGCLVESSLVADIASLGDLNGLAASVWTQKMKKAFAIANCDSERAVTHNKGIMNGVDAVALATGNDFRAIEAAAHAYAATSGTYRSLSSMESSEGQIKLSLKLPLSMGTVGGLTRVHSLAAFALDLMGVNKVEDLMSITASVGLASNFAAVSALVSSGIQKGHMKMHLSNIFMQLQVNPEEEQQLVKFLEGKTISMTTVKEELQKLRMQGELC